MLVDKSKTLEELEGDRWGRPRFPSYVVTTCHYMRRKLLRDLSDEELRLAIGQQIGLAFPVPVALERLAADPLACGDMYEGALLEHVLLTAPSASLDPDQLSCLDHIVHRFHEASAELEAGWREECLPAIEAALEQYRTFRALTPPSPPL